MASRKARSKSAVPLGELAQIQAHLRRLGADIDCPLRTAALLIQDNSPGNAVCYLVDRSALTIDIDLLPGVGDIDTVLADLAKLPTLTVAELQNQIGQRNASEITPKYLREMADRIERAKE